MKTIRPYEFFDRLETPYSERLITLTIPDSYSPTLLNSAILITAMRLSRGKRFFEFGTGRGLTSSLIAANTDAEVFTMDVKDRPEHDVSRRFFDLHAPFKGKPAWVGQEWEPSITQLWGPSSILNFEGYYQMMDVCFVDGGSDYDTILSDSKNAEMMTRPGGFIFLHYMPHSDSGAPKVAEDWWFPKGAAWIEESYLLMLEC